MSASQKYYVLTETAAHDFRQARIWSNKRWGKALTRQYFIDLLKGAEYIAQNNQSFPSRTDLSGELEIGVYPVREHYMVYVPVKKDFVVIVALIRQTQARTFNSSSQAITGEVNRSINNLSLNRKLKRLKAPLLMGKLWNQKNGET